MLHICYRSSDRRSHLCYTVASVVCLYGIYYG